MEAPEVHAHHAHHGSSLLEKTLAGAAFVVSLVSLYLGIHHGQIMERLVAANSWPHVALQATVIPGSRPGEVKLSVDLRNKGVGPARIESLEL